MLATACCYQADTAGLVDPNQPSTSIAFHPSFFLDGIPPDVVFVSSDNVHFYAHQHYLLSVSVNRMGNLIPPHAVSITPLIISISQPSAVVNIVLHTMYGLSCLHYHPTLEMVEAALDALAFSYGVPVQLLAQPDLPLYTLIVSFAPYSPLDAYAVAGKHKLENAAVAISSHLLAYDLSRLPDAAVQKMGPLYLKRLVLLQRNRLDALRNIVVKAPEKHPIVPGCNEELQQQMLRAWAHAVAQLVWDVRPSESRLSTLRYDIFAAMKILTVTADDPEYRCVHGCAAVAVGAHRRGNSVRALPSCAPTSYPGGCGAVAVREGPLFLHLRR